MARKCLVSRGHKIIVSLWVLWFIGVYCGDFKMDATSAQQLDIMEVSTIAGKTAALPCNTDLPHSSEELLFIVWYKEGTAICSYDNRVKDSAAYWVSDVMRERLSWIATKPSILQIHDIIPTDQALYWCRIEFKISPTRNQYFLVDVIELPSTPRIFDGQNREVVGLAGPFFENTTLRLTCVVEGGNPMPRLRWWRNNKEITQLHQIDDASSVSQLVLFIPMLSRSHYENLYSCSAENTDLVPPLKRDIQIGLYLRALSVKFLLTDVPFAVQQTYNTACRTVGARPPASITWWLGDTRLNSSEEGVSENLNETISILRWTPQMENNGQLLKCRASHTVLRYGPLEISLTLDLQYPPIVDLRLGFRVKPEELREGTDVYFECDVQARPPPYKIVWKHNDQLITYNPKKGIIMGTMDGSGYLTLQKALRNQSGIYTCTVSNVEGDTKSNPFSLELIYKPVCEFTGVRVVAAIRNKETKITCSTNAYPNPDFFQWSIQNSSGMFNIESDKFTFENGSSTLSFTTTKKADHGTITCKATNRAGQQVEPCQYFLINAVKPEILTKCSVKKVNKDLQVQCIAGYSGGLETTHVLEVWESGHRLMKLSNKTPDWKFNCPNTENDLKLFVYSYNAAGRSEKSHLRVKLRLRSQLPTVPTSINETSHVAWVSGIGLTGAIVLMVVIILAKKRYSQQAHTADTNSTFGFEMTPKPKETSKSCSDTESRDAQLPVTHA